MECRLLFCINSLVKVAPPPGIGLQRSVLKPLAAGCQADASWQFQLFSNVGYYGKRQVEQQGGDGAAVAASAAAASAAAAVTMALCRGNKWMGAVVGELITKLE